MRLIVLLLVGIALPNVYMKYLLLEIDGDETPEVDTESDTEAEHEAVSDLGVSQGTPHFLAHWEKDDDSNGDMKNDNDNVDEETGGPSRDYKNDSDNPNEVPETPEKPPKTMKEALKSTSKPSNKNEKNAGAGSLDGSSLKNHPKRKLVNAKTCGYYRVYQQSITRVDLEFREFPWLVMIGSVEDDGTVAMYNCGGSLITMSVVLTAAHCLFPLASDVQYDKLRVKIGAERRDQQSGFEEIDVVKMIAHEKYEPDPEFKNDIALLKLKHAYNNKGKEWGKKANTICLPFDEKPNEKYLDMDVTVAGWGYTRVEGDESSNPANQLEKRVTRVMEHAKCKQAHAKSGSQVLESNNVCAGGEEGKDSCSGDSGGPLMIKRKAKAHNRKRWIQIGLVSWGFVCGTPGIPGVYTNVQHYLKWILDHL